MIPASDRGATTRAKLRPTSLSRSQPKKRSTEARSQQIVPALWMSARGKAGCGECGVLGHRLEGLEGGAAGLDQLDAVAEGVVGVDPADARLVVGRDDDA